MGFYRIGKSPPKLSEYSFRVAETGKGTFAEIKN